MHMSRRGFLRGAIATLPLIAARRGLADRPASLVAPHTTPPGILPGPRWNPAGTWVFAVGILEWQRAGSYAPFPTAGRKDAVLMDRFRARGVPPEQIVMLNDRAATHDELPRALARVLARTRPGELLFFYYAGHGSLDDAGAMFMIPYDTGAALATTAWPLSAALAQIDATHRGPVLLAGDCCHSGAMVTAASRPHPVPYAAIASSLSSEASTGAWTFTECLIAGLEGTAPASASSGGQVTLASLADYAVTRMAYEEEQLASFAAGTGFPSELQLGPGVVRVDARVGTYVKVRWHDRWFRSRIDDVRSDGQLRVHYVGYPVTDDEWVTAARVQPYAPTQFAVGTRVDAEWHRRWYPAVVLEARLGIHHIHYDGFGNEWDEWVSSRRIRRARATPRVRR